ncbi:MAG TPA: hypothetical protein VMN39_04690, partial [Longimicrobiaceae bacterium]|nr:hypothetical protein [Longimicrobiaceae bacterium]
MVDHLDGGDYSAGYSVKIFRRPHPLPSLDSNGFYPLTGLTLLRTIYFEQPAGGPGSLIVRQIENGTGRRDWKLVYTAETDTGGITDWTLTESVDVDQDTGPTNEDWIIFRKHEIRMLPGTGGALTRIFRSQEAVTHTSGQPAMATVRKVWESWKTFTIAGQTFTRIVERRLYGGDTPTASLPSPAGAPSGAHVKYVYTHHEDSLLTKAYGRAATREEHIYDGSAFVKVDEVSFAYGGGSGYDVRSWSRSRAGVTEVIEEYTSVPPAGVDRERYPVQPGSRSRKLGGVFVEFESRDVSLVSGEIKVLLTRFRSSGVSETEERYYPYSGSSDPEDRWRPSAVKRPGGTWTTYAYALVSGGGRTVTVTSGAGTRTAITKGFTTVTTYNWQGYPISELVTDIESGGVVSEWEALIEDDDGRPTKTNFHSDANDYEQLVYACCGVESRRDRLGLVTGYDYDIFGRLVGQSVGHATPVVTATSWSVNGGGGLTTTVERVLSTGSKLVRSNATDAAGRVTSVLLPDLDGETNPEQTIYARGVETIAGVEYRKDTVTRDIDGTTSAVSVTYRHGSGEVFEYRGNAVADTRFLYEGPSASYRHSMKTIRLKTVGGSENADEWERTTFDGLGDIVTREIAPGGTTWTESYTYNTSASHGLIGQLKTVTDMDGVVTEYRYDELGRMKRQGIPIDGAGFDYTEDRVSQILHDVVDDDDATHGLGRVAHRTRRYAYLGSSATPVRLSTEYRAVDGRSGRTEAFGRHTRREFSEQADTETLAYGDGMYKMTETRADGTQTVTRYSDWRPYRILHRDSTGADFGGVLFMAYDGLGR